MRTLLLLVGSLSLLSACTPVQSEQGVPRSSASSSSATGAPAAMERTQKSSSSAKVVPAKAAVTASAASKKSASAALSLSSSSSREWDKSLTAEQMQVLRDGGTETPYTSPLLDEHRKGTYVSADCGEPVFRSEQKFDSGTGWPSFWAPISANAVVEHEDRTAGIVRTEIRSKCGGHLGHVFSDGPEPTGLRYCMNGLALKFIPDAVQ